jgi:hypothetical protein
MLQIVIACTRNGQFVPTGIETDVDTFIALPEALSLTRCPACGGNHYWTKSQTWICNTESSSRALLPAEVVGGAKDPGEYRQAAGAFAEPIRSVELIVQPGAKDGVGEMGVRGGLSPGRSATASAGRGGQGPCKGTLLSRSNQEFQRRR